MTTMNQRMITVTLQQSSAATAFLQSLHNEKVPIYHVRYKASTIQFHIARHHLHVVRRARRKYRVKCTIQYASPSRILQRDFVTFFGVTLLVLLPILLMQFIWKIDVDADTLELEDEVAGYLQNELAIRLPMRHQAFGSDHQLRQQLMENFSQFSWIYITKKGSSITISPQLAPKIAEKPTVNLQQHLVASSNGVITHFKIDRGIRQVEPNMTVYEGDTLVLGVLVRGEDYFIVGAEGEVFADYWLETTFSIPKIIEMDVLTDYGWKYEVNWPQFKEVWRLKSMEPIKLMIEHIPYRIVQRKKEKINETDVDSIILPLLHEKMLRSLPPKSTIKSEKLLHVSADDDTVKGKVLFLVNENIAKPHPIHQGE